jgi:hypothetical protein
VNANNKQARRTQGSLAQPSKAGFSKGNVMSYSPVVIVPSQAPWEEHLGKISKLITVKTLEAMTRCVNHQWKWKREKG